MIALALITHYPRWYRGKLQSIKHTDKVRGDLALEFISRAIRDKYQVVSVDGQSSRSFCAALRNLPVIFKRRNIGKRAPAKRLAFKLAAKLPDIQAIVATEPEKIDLLRSIPDLVNPIIHGDSDLVIPARREPEFSDSYPAFQYNSEIEGNRLYNEYLRVHGLLNHHHGELDVFFGPRVFRNNSKILALFTQKSSIRVGKHSFDNEFFDPEEISNASFFPIVLALKRKYKVTSVTVPFIYPGLQKENEEVGNREYFEEKRRSQRLGILVDLMRFLTYFGSKR